MYHGSDLERLVMKQLLDEESETGKYRALITQRIDRFFAEKWDPNCVPEVLSVKFDLYREGGFVVLRVNTDAQSAYWKTEYWGRSEVRFAWSDYRTAEELKAQIRAILPQLLQCAGGQMTAGLPSEKTIQLWTSRKTPGKVLMVLVHQIYRVEEGRPAEKQRQLEVLDSLNTTEMAVLRYVTQKGETSISAAASALADQVCTTKAYNGACLERLKK